MHDPLQRIIKFQTIVAAIAVAAVGLALMAFDGQVSNSAGLRWLSCFPWSEVLVAAILGLGLGPFTNKD